MTPEESLVYKLIEKGMHIAFAESCTAGLCAARLVNVPDASKVLDVSFVTYANEAKMRYLGVGADTIGKYGVVSEQVACEMACGAAHAAKAEAGVGISGIAGPGGGTQTKPVGTVCFGFFVNGESYTFTERFGDIGRNEVRRASCDFVYDKLNEIVEKNPI